MFIAIEIVLAASAAAASLSLAAYVLLMRSLQRVVPADMTAFGELYFRFLFLYHSITYMN
jgi:hypothetical protein